MGKYWLNFVFLTSRDKNETVLLRDIAPQTSLRESAAGDVWWTVSRNITVLSLDIVLAA